jgi:hypothetical protein
MVSRSENVYKGFTRLWKWSSNLAATDDRCANFSASTCPTQTFNLQQALSASKLPLEKFHRLLDLIFWGNF